MAKKVFDEAAFLQAMSQGHSYHLKREATAPETSVVGGASQPAAEPPSGTTSAPRSRRERVSDYEAVFLAPREPIEKRSVVTLRLELYEVIATIIKRIGTNGVSAQAFVENVLRHHLTEYQDEINRLNREKLKKDIL